MTTMTCGGDEWFAITYARYYPPIERFLRGLLSGHGDPSDLAQEVFLRLHQRGEGEGEVRFWLFRVARNLALNELKRHRIRSALQPLLSFFSVTPPTPFELADAAQQRRLVLAELTRLVADQRAAILLREWEDMSYEEIARSLGVSVAKVKSDVFRARLALRQAM